MHTFMQNCYFYYLNKLYMLKNQSLFKATRVCDEEQFNSNDEKLLKII